MDDNGVWSDVYDTDLNQIRTTVVVGPATPAEPSDRNGVLSRVYDPATNSLRVVIV